MPPTIGSVVEGFGDVKAVPVLLRRLAEEHGVRNLQITQPVRIPRSKIFRQDQRVIESEVERAIQLAVNKLPSREEGAILIVLDADLDCPAEMGPRLVETARKLRPDVTFGVVLPKHEYEAWFLASLESLHEEKEEGRLQEYDDPESIRDPKREVSRILFPNGRYSETVDQAKLTAKLDLQQAQRTRSFTKLVKEVHRLLDHVCPTRER